MLITKLEDVKELKKGETFQVILEGDDGNPLNFDKFQGTYDEIYRQIEILNDPTGTPIKRDIAETLSAEEIKAAETAGEEQAKLDAEKPCLCKCSCEDKEPVDPVRPTPVDPVRPTPVTPVVPVPVDPVRPTPVPPVRVTPATPANPGRLVGATRGNVEFDPSLLRWQKVEKGEPVSWFFDQASDCWNKICTGKLKAEVERVLADVSAVAGIKFVEADSAENADLKYSFDVVDGQGGVLAFAVVPAEGTEMSACGSPCGSVTQDIEEDLTIVDYFSVTLHETIHALGVPHLQSGIMIPSYRPAPERFDLNTDDAAVIELLKRYPL